MSTYEGNGTVCNYISTTSVTSGAGAAYPSAAHEFIVVGGTTMVDYYIWHHGALSFVSKPNSNIIKEMDFIFDFWCFNATFSNISAIPWRPILVVEESRENHQLWVSNW
jgi:hypothetical protein